MSENLTRRVLEARNVVQRAVIESVVDRSPRGLELAEVDQPSRVGIHLAEDRELDAVAVTVNASALVIVGDTREPMRGFETELVYETDLHAARP